MDACIIQVCIFNVRLKYKLVCLIGYVTIGSILLYCMYIFLLSAFLFLFKSVVNMHFFIDGE